MATSATAKAAAPAFLPDEETIVVALLSALWIWFQVPDVPKQAVSTGGLAAELATLGRILRHPASSASFPA